MGGISFAGSQHVSTQDRAVWALLEQGWPELGNGQILVLVGDTAWGPGALTRVSQAEHVSRYPCVGGVGQDRGILETQAEWASWAALPAIT